MRPPEMLLTKIEQFRRNREAYSSPSYKEAQLRQDFLNPLFTALGWDMDNRQGLSENLREVIHEDTLRMPIHLEDQGPTLFDPEALPEDEATEAGPSELRLGSATKAPDYAFCVGGKRKFFVEAKKPSVRLAEVQAPAYQLRRYAWSASLPVSILTDFEEFAIYDCRIQPKWGDSPKVARIRALTFGDYEQEWDWLKSVFSKEAVLAGSLEKYAATFQDVRGILPVDKAFLKDMEQWRELLAEKIAQLNPTLSAGDMNAAVQSILDRILFLRIAEDRGLERYGRLNALTSGPTIYPRMTQFFREADSRYNSGLFHFSTESNREPPDNWTLGLEVPDQPLNKIITSLYYPQSPYQFSVIPVELLGQVYEQFLGKVIEVGPERKVKVTEKPEVRKAGGVYYTPQYIVDYIVQNTVGAMFEGKTLKEVAKMTILDPACGSGSFLLGAYEYLLHWYQNWYAEHNPQQWQKGPVSRLYQVGPNSYKLTLQERKRILLTHIFGVDIDRQAVEVTKLSLLLRVLEGETHETISSLLQFYKERALPDLDRNVKCGNSLINPEIVKMEGWWKLDNKAKDEDINPFDWSKEFPSIIKSGGFDIVLGNPPYVNIDDTWGKGDLRCLAIKEQYPLIYNDKTDILFYFLFQAVQLSKGRVGFIVSRAFLEAYKANKLRKYLNSNTAIMEIVDFRNHYVFTGVGITTCIVIMAKSPPAIIKVYKMRDTKVVFPSLREVVRNKNVFDFVKVDQKRLGTHAWALTSETVAELDEKIDRAGEALGNVLFIGQGMQTGRNEVFGKRTWAEIKQWGLAKGMYYRRATNSDIRRYHIRDRGEYIIYPHAVSSFSQLPAGIRKYLQGHEAELKSRAAFKRGDCEWWQYTWPLHLEYYVRNRIVCPYLAARNRFAFAGKTDYLTLTDTTVIFENGQRENMLYILVILNSRLLTYRFQHIGKLKSGGIYEYFWNSISKLPIRRIDFSNVEEIKTQKQLVTLAQRIMKLNDELYKDKILRDQSVLKREVDVLDGQIDQIVYGLYGLTAKEIQTVEEATR